MKLFPSNLKEDNDIVQLAVMNTVTTGALVESQMLFSVIAFYFFSLCDGVLLCCPGWPSPPG